MLFLSSGQMSKHPCFVISSDLYFSAIRYRSSCIPTVNKPDLTKTKVHTFATRHKTIHINLQFTKYRKSKDVDMIVGAEI